LADEHDHAEEHDEAAEGAPAGADTDAGGGEGPRGDDDAEAPPAADEPDAQLVEEMLATLRQAKVAPLILSTVSTFASVAYGKLELNELGEAKTAIDAIDALLPLLHGEVDEAILRDFERSLAELKLGYADAVASAK
jgi:hypothetical protein